jgi:O-antigen/teichoic acid export membrane protein
MSDVAATDGTDRASGVIRRFSWGLGDQMLSSATNFMLGALVARAVDLRDFGAFSLVYATFTLSLGASRAVIGDPLVVRFSSVPDDRWREGVQMAAGSAVTIGSIVGLACIVAALLLGGSLTVVLVVLGISFPALLLQDTWRYALFAHGRGSAAFLNDLTWAAVMFATFSLLIHARLSTVGWFTAAWASGGIAAAVVGLFQLRIAPSGPSSALRWFHLHRDLVPRFFAEFALNSGSSSLLVFGIGSLTSLAQLGQLRAGQVALGPLNILFLGAGMATVPEGVRMLRESPRRLMHASRWVSVAMASGVVLWGAVVLTLPSNVGIFALGRNWESARSFVLPLSIAAVGYGFSFGAMTGLRSLAAARRSLRARSIDASASLILVLSAASLGGAHGAAWGFAVAGCLRIATAWWQFTRAMREYEAGLVPRSFD